jgi:hypothetical protein
MTGRVPGGAERFASSRIVRRCCGSSFRNCPAVSTDLEISYSPHTGQTMAMPCVAAEPCCAVAPHMGQFIAQQRSFLWVSSSAAISGPPNRPVAPLALFQAFASSPAASFQLQRGSARHRRDRPVRSERPCNQLPACSSDKLALDRRRARHLAAANKVAACSEWRTGERGWVARRARLDTQRPRRVKMSRAAVRNRKPRCGSASEEWRSRKPEPVHGLVARSRTPPNIARNPPHHGRAANACAPMPQARGPLRRHFLSASRR